MAIEEVIVVEDDASLRLYLEEVLGGAGYRVKAFASAEESLPAISGNASALVTDLRLPGMSGADLIQEIKRRNIRLGTVLITAYATEDITVEMASKGIEMILAKPFTNTELLTAVDDALHDTRRLHGEKDSLEVRRLARGWVEITSPSRQEYLKRLEEFVEILYGANLTAKEREDIKIAVSEMCSNAMEWGNKGDPNRRVRISYCLFPDEFVLKIEDEGEGFHPDAIPDPSKDPLGTMSKRSKAGKRAGGYGLHIVRRIMDSVVYNDTGNTALLTKRLGVEHRETTGEVK